MKKEESLKENARKISIAEGSGYSVMDGFGLRYITPYALALGVSNFFIGVLSSLPALIGNFSQLFGSTLIRKNSRKKIVRRGVLFQALSWIPLILVGIIALLFQPPLLLTSLLLLFFYTIIIASAAHVGPAWSSWMKDIVTKNTDSYFAKRNTIAGATGLISGLIAGFVLDFFKNYHYLLGFWIIFSIALLGRGFSFYMFKKQYEPKLKLEEKYYFTLIQFLKKMPHNNFGKFVIFSAIISLSVAIASPFFSVYMLKNLQFSYTNYTLVVTIAIVSSLLFMPLWGKLANKYGSIKVLQISSSLIFLLPLFWFFIPFLFKNSHSSILFYLLIVEGLSGFVWAGFNLSTGNFIFHAVTNQRIAYCAAYTAILSSFGAFIGATLGGLITSYHGTILFLEPILFIFLLSSFLRLVTFLFLFSRIKEVREVEKFGLEEVTTQLVHDIPRGILHKFGVRRTGFDSEAHY